MFGPVRVSEMPGAAERLIGVVNTCLVSITQPRLYETERAFQGEFLANLRDALPEVGLPGQAIVEQEYQKRYREHGIVVRPDIIIHVPTLTGGESEERQLRSV